MNQWLSPISEDADPGDVFFRNLRHLTPKFTLLNSEIYDTTAP